MRRSGETRAESEGERHCGGRSRRRGLTRVVAAVLASTLALTLGVPALLGLPIPQAEEIAAGYLEVVEQSEDHKEGPRAFVEKRKPRWDAG